LYQKYLNYVLNCVDRLIQIRWLDKYSNVSIFSSKK